MISYHIERKMRKVMMVLAAVAVVTMGMAMDVQAGEKKVKMIRVRMVTAIGPIRNGVSPRVFATGARTIVGRLPKATAAG
jgi:hypothetical protein